MAVNLSDPFYISNGKAGEYSTDLSLNIFKFCPFSCTYCYVPKMLKISAKQYFTQRVLAVNILERVRKYAPKYKDRTVFMSFIGDIFNNLPEFDKLRNDIFDIFLNNRIKLELLTKGNAIDYFKKLVFFDSVKFGITLTSLDIRTVSINEPFALNPYLRIAQLKQAKILGFNTWISIEPILKPDELIRIIDLTHEFTDFYFFGKLNYKESSYDNLIYYLCKALDYLDSLKKNYIVKNDTISLIREVE